MSKFETNISLNFEINFGTNSPSFKITTGVGVSMYNKIKNDFGIQQGINISHNITSGGNQLGTLTDDNTFFHDTVISYYASLNHGQGKRNPMIISTLHSGNSNENLDRSKFSVTTGTNLIFSNVGRNQQVGFFQLRANDFTLQTFNDVKGFPNLLPFSSDGGDKFWTAGGVINFGSLYSNTALTIGTEVFTMYVNNNISNAKPAPKGTTWFDGDYIKDGQVVASQINQINYPYNPYSTESTINQDKNAKNSDFLKFFQKNSSYNKFAHSEDLNQGHTYAIMRHNGTCIDARWTGRSQMFSQDIVHNALGIHLINSSREDKLQSNNHCFGTMNIYNNRR